MPFWVVELKEGSNPTEFPYSCSVFSIFLCCNYRSNWKFYVKKILANQIPSLIISAVISVVIWWMLYSNYFPKNKSSMILFYPNNNSLFEAFQCLILLLINCVITACLCCNFGILLAIQIFQICVQKIR